MMEEIKANASLQDLCKSYQIQSLSVFGSYARNQNKTESDIDLVVVFKKPIGLLAFIELEEKIQDILGKKIDLVTESELSPYFKDQVLKEKVTIYESKI